MASKDMGPAGGYKKPPTSTPIQGGKPGGGNATGGAPNGGLQPQPKQPNYNGTTKGPH